MVRRSIILFFLFSLVVLPLLASDTTRPENTDADAASATQEMESEGIIPAGGLTVSTQPITPVAVLPEKNVYDQGLEELTLAQDLWKKSRMEAASDVALQAYDDLMAVSVPRRNREKRKKLRADRHQAATVYIGSSIAYIQNFVRRGGASPKIVEEGRVRLGDLRDVSMSYPELNKNVSKALEDFEGKPSSPPVANPQISSSTARAN